MWSRRAAPIAAQIHHGVDQTIRAYHLGSILNLRGGTPRDDFYAREVSAAKQAGIEYYDLPMSAMKRPTRNELLALIDLFEHCRYPILIHCKSGSDRTGLASALYRLVVMKEPPEQAQEAFSYWRGHVPLFGTQHLHEPLHEYAAWLQAHDLSHTPARFLGWIEHEYRSDDGPSRPFVPVRSGPRAEIARQVSRTRAAG